MQLPDFDFDSITEANEHRPTVAQAYAAWQEQITKGETMGVIQMYEDAYIDALHESIVAEQKEWL